MHSVTFKQTSAPMSSSKHPGRHSNKNLRNSAKLAKNVKRPATWRPQKPTASFQQSCTAPVTTPLYQIRINRLPCADRSSKPGLSALALRVYPDKT